MDWIKEKLISIIWEKKLGTAAVQETVKTIWAKVDGFKTHLIGAITALASLVALINQITVLLGDGFQYPDVVAVTNSSHLYTLLFGLAAMTGRSALTKYGESLKAWQEANKNSNTPK